MNVTNGSLWLSKKLFVVLTVGLLLLLKLPIVYSVPDQSITTSGNYIIPAGVTALVVDIWGAGGSGSGFIGTTVTPYAGGSGSYVHCQLNMASVGGTTTISVIVGQGGQAPAYNTGGNGPNAIGGGGSGNPDDKHSPGGGGGRSTIKNPSTPAADWVTAGGGGGGGISNCSILS